MKPSKTLAALLLLASTSAMAAPSVIALKDLPAICQSAAFYAAIPSQIYFSDGSWGDAYDPKHLKTTQDFKRFPITKVTDLGDCDESPNLKPSWCNIAGGTAEVFDVQVSSDQDGTGKDVFPVADVIVTWNRGSCHAVEMTTPNP